MRSVTQAGSDYLDQNTLGAPAHLITITLYDGFIERLTDWDASLAWQGNTFETWVAGSHPAIDLRGRNEVAGTEIGSLKLAMLCGTDSKINGNRIPSFALEGGFAGAWVKVERAFLSSAIDIIDVMHLFEGPVSEAKPTNYEVHLEIESGMALLSQQSPHVTYQPACTHQVYDSGCTLTRSEWTVTGTVIGPCTTTSVGSGLTQIGGYFNQGVMTFATGALAGQSRSVRDHNGGGVGTQQCLFVPDRPWPAAPANGDTFTVWPGCSGSKASCTRFDNMVHFRGFPLVPKNETGRIG